MQNPTSDTLQAAQLFPSTAEQLLMKITDTPFIHQRQINSYFEAPDQNHLKMDDLPKMSKPV
jgi:hypothetical protein